MKCFYQPLLLVLLAAQSPVAFAEPPIEVQAALDWTMPLNQCRKPNTIKSHQRVVAAGGAYFQAPSTSAKQGPATTTISDVDHYQIKRFERKKIAWEACVKRYKSELLEQFIVLKNSAQYGLTEPQAQNILTKLAQIQAVIISPEGVSTGEEAVPSNEK